MKFWGSPTSKSSMVPPIPIPVSNLLDNAIKYTEPGGAVTVRLANRKEDILVEVSDTGIGIRPEDLPCVFDAFCRIDKKAEGSGLGLSIAKAIVSAHGGTITLESTFGKGSTFRFTLPKMPRPNRIFEGPRQKF